MSSSSIHLKLSVLAVASLLSAVGIAQPTEPPAPAKPAEQPAPEKKPPAEDDSLPSLDESLGLQEKPKDAAKKDDKTADSDLDKQLRDEELGDDLTQAAAIMDKVAGRLETSKDTGLATQRMQDDALRRLDKLISDAKKQRQQQQKKKRPQNQQQKQDQNQSQQQQQQNQQQASESSKQNQDNRGEVLNPAARRDGALRQVSPGGTAAWGNLPEHIRSSLMQGFSDQFSAIYQSMTEAYYRRLAEDKGRGERTGEQGSGSGGSP